MSEFQTLGLSIHLFKPSHTFNATTHKSAVIDTGTLLADLSATINSYQHTIGIVGGFLSASFDMTCTLDEMETWYADGVGAHVVVVDAAGVTVWEGFVDSVDISVGGQTIRRGPLMDVGNSVLLTYSLQDTTTSPPSSGNNTLSTGAEDTASIATYGVRQQIVNAGSCTAAQAMQYLQLWMIENAWPRTSQDIDLAGGGGMTVSFSCLGYFNFLDYYYHNVSNAAGSITGTVNLSTKIASILDYDWAGWFSSANASIATNTTQVKAYEGDWTEAGSLIKEMIELGDSSYNRYLFMIGPERYVTYAQVPTTARYTRAFTDPYQAIWENGAPTPLWAVRPGEWVRLTDWLVTQDDPASYYTDSRFMLIEQVSFTAPWGLSLSSGRSDRLAQMIAQLGLKGKE
jgi:hypothetical protein